jgi:threonine dehydratase
MTIAIADIVAARTRIAERIRHTPVHTASKLGERVGVWLHVKCESLQKTGSFKTRGALNAVLRLPQPVRERGVVTVSAGNHAQAVAWACGIAGVPATVVMPVKASPPKVAASRGYGADVVLHGETGFEAFAHAHELEAERGLHFLHPFDDPAVIAGAGTVALELLDDMGEVDVVVIPIGGGGLAAGMGVALRDRLPSVRIYGVEPTGAASMHMSMARGEPVRLDTIATIADGLASPMAGSVTYPLIRDNFDDVVLVTDQQIAAAMGELLLYTKLLAEPAGAAATAALLEHCIPVNAGDRVAVILSGGNVDLARLCELTSSSEHSGRPR